MGARAVDVSITGRNASLKRALSDSERDVAKLRRDLDKHTSAMRSSFGGVVRSVGLIGGALAGVGAVKGLFVDPIKSAGDFQQKLSVLKAVSNGTTSEMKLASKAAIKLGADIRLPTTTAQGAADAMLELAKGGLSMKQAISSAHATLLLSTAAQIDNAGAAKAVVNAMSTFGLKAKDTKKIVDDFAGAANASTADIGDVTDALQFAGQGFHALKVPVGDAATAIALMANAGQKGGVAGAALNVAMTKLAAPTVKAQALMDQLGVKVFDSHGKFVGMRGAIENMTPILDKMSQKQRLATLAVLGGTRGMRALNIVLGGGLPLWDKTHKAVTRTGQAQQLANAQTSGFKGAMAALRSSIETIQLQIGLKLLPAMTTFVRFLSKELPGAVKFAVGAIRDVTNWLGIFQTKAANDHGLNGLANGVKTTRTRFDELKAAIRRAVDIGKEVYAAYQRHATLFQTIGGAVAGLVIGWKLYTAAVRVAAVVQAAFNLVMAANPIGLVVVAIAALVGALAVLYFKNKTVHAAVQATFQWMRTNIPPIVKEVEAIIKNVWGKIAPYVATIWASIKGQFAGVVTMVRGAFNLIGDVIHGRWSAAWNDVKTIFSGAWNTVEAWFAGVPKVLLQLALKAGQAIASGVKSGLGNLKDYIYNNTVGAIPGLGSTGAQDLQAQLKAKIAAAKGKKTGAATGAWVAGNYAAGDRVPAMLAGGEAVLNPTQIEIVGRDRVMGALAATGAPTIGNAFAAGKMPDRGSRLGSGADSVSSARINVAKWRGLLKKDQRDKDDLQKWLFAHQDGAARGSAKHPNPKHPVWQKKYDLLQAPDTGAMDRVTKDTRELAAANRALTAAVKAQTKTTKGSSAIPGSASFASAVDAINAKLAEDAYNNASGDAVGPLSGVEQGDYDSLIGAYTGRIGALKKLLLQHPTQARRDAINQELATDYSAILGFQSAKLADNTPAADTSGGTTTPGSSDPGTISPDAQAQIDQLSRAVGVAKYGQGISDAALRSFGGSGDIGEGGFGNAWQASQGGPNIIIQTLHPGDPATLAAIGQAATAGQSLQSYVTSPRLAVNV